MDDFEHSDGNVAFNTFIGVFVSIFGNALISVALNLQKKAHNNIQEQQIAQYSTDIDNSQQWMNNGIYLPDDEYSSPIRTSLEGQQHKFVMKTEDNTEYLKSKLWWFGISLMVFGEIGNFVAYGFAPASTIAPLGTTTLVANVILAPLMLKEVFRKRDLVGVFLAVTGAALVVFSSNSEETALTPELIMESLGQIRSVIYFILTGIAIIILTLLSPIYGSNSIMIDLGLVAIYGGYTVLSTKSVASLLSLTFFKMFTYPVSYLLIFVLILTAILQIKYLNKALQRFDSTEVIPTQFVLFTISAIIGSAVLYHDFDGMTLNQMSRFISGCAIEFLGVYLITSKRTKKMSDSFSNLSISADSSSTIVGENNEITMNNKKRNSGRLFISDDNQQQQQSSSRPATNNSFEAWQGYNTLSNNTNHKRHSSVFRGISMTSQLLDRNDEEQAAIQLPLSSSSNNNTTSSFMFTNNKKRDSALLSSFIHGITSAITNNNHEMMTAEENDAIEIEIPTPSSFRDRELMPITQNNKRDSLSRSFLVDIDVNSQQQQQQQYRDLS
ncbi:magnesium transporter NIPA-domain-containing protein [Cokeromyces recurvatus]|uniref:magnesium transporter NIPA-domain-containing protein n=1 Tax=Cokeromyces recurvatus TaxID=90255 RepID=UPI002221032D|nr:magnesium transporter NIPA-domain-containing protein [Cokeromyces recurvatus]KAI7905620.1 magnesium transporter NIPA-domain-containing protein [Cokeromyces recurvatus]